MHLNFIELFRKIALQHTPSISKSNPSIIWQSSTQNGSSRRAMMAFRTNHINLPVNH